jgi:NADPH:quinone reductase-like Zn-dependent oxidoreductase
MKAALLLAYGDTTNLSYTDIDTPAPGPSEVLVRVHASSLNNVETYLRQGYLAQMMPMPIPAVLGVDLAGVVEAVGAEVHGFKAGDRVVGRVPVNGRGSHADYAVVSAGGLAILPESISFETGASLPLVALAGRQAVEAAKVKPGDRVLVTGGVGGVGRSAVQYLKELGGVSVAGVLPQHMDAAKALADEALILDEASGTAAFDAIVDTVGGTVAEKAIKLAKDGAAVAGTAGFPEGINADGRVEIINVFSSDNAAQLAQIVAAAERGDLTMPIAKSFHLSELAQAYDLLATRPDGKIVITR